ncbi:cobalamin B12-binding domain-containing protein [Alicyclobacillus acidocaldarius]|uniref:Cobalamin B12-binding domain protein n=1 Tax=Alicyclobacillus acidocaldarius subsp. acidocaldarius (strain ATCC 27009 / DSM 446 / BCRC 14685 / JCM 5260 / KCTC 1825 / NBRC 15652 / NCIMB 11725 / NRRL B-14509 / 104-IA) TaxID=521098 RepID=C8WTI1_ALIAD|nr:cobalamin-dependent protein [Alicyclobacillus acidocaldarius]ACV57723.1 cobalamin B12-binding domain protein [Alicyclobacillus acidocaldarius subsp. acidocaldarius DSM 446]
MYQILKLVESLLDGDEERAWGVIQAYIQSGANSTYVFDVLLRNAMVHIGTLWEINAISVADEHLASTICERLVARYRDTHLQKPDTPSRRSRVMLFCVEGEAHDLGLKMVAAAFEEAGYETRLYGRNLSLEYARLAALRWHPDIVGISVTMVYHLPKLRSYIHALESLAHRPQILVGGRLAQSYDLRPYVGPKTFIITDIMQLQAWMNQQRAMPSSSHWGAKDR